LILTIGFVTYARNDEGDWDYEDDEVEGDEDLRDMAIPQRNQSDDDWDDWN